MKKPITPPDLPEKIAIATDALSAAEAALAVINAGEEDAALAGFEARQTWRRRREEAEDRCHVATRTLANLRRQAEDAERDEQAVAASRAYDSATAELDRIVTDALTLADETRKKTAALMTRARRVQADICRVNANLPGGRPPIVAIERDPRLAAGTMTEHSGFFITPRPLTIFDPEFFVSEAPPQVAVILPKKPTPPTGEPPKNTGALRVVTMPGALADMPGEPGTGMLKVFRAG